MDRSDLEQWRARDVARLLALVESQRRYFQDLVAALPVGVLVLSSDLLVVLANKAVRNMFGLPDQGPFNLSIVLPPWVLARVERVIKTANPESGLVVDAGPGRRLEVAIVATSGWEEGGGPEALITLQPSGPGVVREVAGGPVPVRGEPTEQALANEVPALLWAVDPRTLRVMFMSAQAEKLLGFRREYWMSNPSAWADRVYPSDRERVINFYQKVAGAGQSHACEFRAVRADGQVVWLRETVQPVADSTGRVRYLAGVTVEITERRLLEEQVVQRERIDALQRLAGRMAHDLNNALMILEGNAEEVLSGLPADSPLRAEVQAMILAVQRVTALTGHLLTFTRRTPPVTELMDIEPVLAALAAAGIRRKGLPIAGMVNANAEQLQQVLMALAAAMRGRGETDISVEAVNIEVREDLQPKPSSLKPGSYAAVTLLPSMGSAGTEFETGVFERFLPERDVPADVTTNLAQAYATVRQWGGDIVVFQGSAENPSFRLLLPRVGGTDSSAIPMPAEAAPPPQRKLATILVVEDEAGIRALVQKFLRKHGYEILEASNGEEALAVLRAHRGSIDLLITDMIMPNMGGRQLVEQLQSQGRELKILYISGYTEDLSVYESELPPGSAFLPKPFTLSALLDKVRGLLG